MNIAQIAGGIGALVAALGGIVWLIRGWWRVTRAVHQLIELIQGRPPRWPGDPEERPGLARHLVQVDAHLAEHAARLARGDQRFDQIDDVLQDIRTQLHPNHGESLRDRVDAVARVTGAAPDSSDVEGPDDEHDL